MMLLLAACSDETLRPGSGEIPDMTGEQVMFTTSLPQGSGAASRSESADDVLIDSYSPMTSAYKLAVKMYRSGEDAPVGECYYAPASTAEGGDGTLTPTTAPSGEGSPTVTPLRWIDNVHAYGFEATAGSENLQGDQTDAKVWLEQDLLQGYGYEPVLGEGGTAIDNINSCNYRNSKEWYVKNQVWMTRTGLIDQNDLRKVPLFMQHRRAMITVRLKAGEGTKRQDLDFATHSTKINTEIYSYNSEGNIVTYEGTTPVADAGVKPLAQEWQCSYTADAQGNPAETRTGVQYHAIVEPHNFLANADTHRICKINVAGQNFSFYAGNDSRYADYKTGTEPAKTEMEAYNLTAGKHLVIDVTLSRESRKILITAYVEDWTEMVTTSVCDDFGLNGDPITIQNRQQLIDFLSDPTKNKAGSIAIVSASTLDLDADGDPWGNHQYDLNCTLNMGGSVARTSSQFVKNITASGSLVYGTIELTRGSTVESVVCDENHGSIEYITVRGQRNSKATVAGIACANYCNITNCTTNITVEGSTGLSVEGKGYVGGIAAKSVYDSGDAALMPTIFNCMVEGLVRVSDGVASNVYSGGIAGIAEGRISGCTYEYGVPLMDEIRRYTGDERVNQSIVYAATASTDKQLFAHNNQWPTAVPNDIGEDSGHNKNMRNDTYNGIINNQRDLAQLVKHGSSIYNLQGLKYRIASDFTVTSDGENGWELKEDATEAYNVYCTIEGNGKTITLTGHQEIEYGATKGSGEKVYSAPILFNKIQGVVRNLNIYCAVPLYGVSKYSEEGKNTFNDGCGTLAYSVDGGKISGINVYGSEDAFVQAATPGGIVVSAYHDAVIENCNCFMPVKLHVGELSDATRRYGGGIVAYTAKASVTRCAYFPKDNTKSISHDYSAGGSNQVFIYLGGIVGGLSIMGEEVPELTITDCSSWYEVKRPEENFVAGSYTSGSIVGTTMFNNNNTPEHGMSDDCEGNWWPLDCVGAGTYNTPVKTEMTVIGIKNSVLPTPPDRPEIPE